MNKNGTREDKHISLFIKLSFLAKSVNRET